MSNVTIPFRNYSRDKEETENIARFLSVNTCDMSADFRCLQTLHEASDDGCNVISSVDPRILWICRLSWRTFRFDHHPPQTSEA
jgi:hypothetical protein